MTSRQSSVKRIIKSKINGGSDDHKGRARYYLPLLCPGGEILCNGHGLISHPLDAPHDQCLAWVGWLGSILYLIIGHLIVSTLGLALAIQNWIPLALASDSHRGNGPIHNLIGITFLPFPHSHYVFCFPQTTVRAKEREREKRDVL